MTARLAIFARIPVAGRVKSRLAAEIGNAAALDAHVQLVESTLFRVAGSGQASTELWIDGPPDDRVWTWVRRWDLVLRRQEGDDLGERMRHALAGDARQAGDLLPSGQPAPVVLIGTDCPPVDRAYVDRAFAALGRHALVLGPAADGGFGLVGWTSPVPGLFDGIVWGGDNVLSGTLRNAIAARCRTCLLPEIWDVDDLAGWKRWLNSRR